MGLRGKRRAPCAGARWRGTGRGCTNGAGRGGRRGERGARKAGADAAVRRPAAEQGRPAGRMHARGVRHAAGSPCRHGQIGTRVPPGRTPRAAMTTGRCGREEGRVGRAQRQPVTDPALPSAAPAPTSPGRYPGSQAGSAKAFPGPAPSRVLGTQWLCGWSVACRPLRGQHRHCARPWTRRAPVSRLTLRPWNAADEHLKAREAYHECTPPESGPARTGGVQAAHSTLRRADFSIACAIAPTRRSASFCTSPQAPPRPRRTQLR